jgi:hypothetical protein
LTYKPEHVVELETGDIVAAVVHGADVADQGSLEASLTQTEATLQTARGGDLEAAQEAPAPASKNADDTPPCGSQPRGKLVADKGYHKATLLQRLKAQQYRTYIPERRQAGRRRWTAKGGTPTAVAFHQNRARGSRPLGKRYHRWRAEPVERTFAHVCETGGARRTRLRGRANVTKRYLLQAAGANLALVMRTLYGLDTPRGWADRAQEALLALFGSVCALLHWERVYRRSLLAFSRPGVAWGPPSADLTACPPALRAGA